MGSCRVVSKKMTCSERAVNEEMMRQACRFELASAFVENITHENVWMDVNYRGANVSINFVHIMRLRAYIPLRFPFLRDGKQARPSSGVKLVILQVMYNARKNVPNWWKVPV